MSAPGRWPPARSIPIGAAHTKATSRQANQEKDHLFHNRGIGAINPVPPKKEKLSSPSPSTPILLFRDISSPCAVCEICGAGSRLRAHG